MLRKALLAAIAVAAVVGAAIAAAIAGPEPQAGAAADHLDAPGLTPPGGNRQLDITDVYAFRSAQGRTALVLNVNGLTPKGKQAQFATRMPQVAGTKPVAYLLRVDNDGDARSDVELKIQFDRADGRGVQPLTVSRNGKVLVRARTTAFGARPVVNRGGGVAVFAGMRDDPFFFDLNGFLNILSTKAGESFLGCKSPRKDAFAGTNVSSIVLDVPSRLLTAGSSTIGVWAATTVGGRQVDRMGRPAINTVFIPNNPFPGEQKGQVPSKKNRFNTGLPQNDVRAFRGEIVNTLRVLHSLNDAAGDDKSDDAGKIDGLADVLLPDILTFDTASAKGFLNGRRLADDVIDAELGLITEGASTTDCVSKNDRPFSRTFPYLAVPHA